MNYEVPIRHPKLSNVLGIVSKKWSLDFSKEDFQIWHYFLYSNEDYRSIVIDTKYCNPDKQPAVFWLSFRDDRKKFTEILIANIDELNSILHDY